MKQRLKYIGENIKKVREAKHMTMAEIAARVDVSEQHIGLIERGRSGVSIDTLIKIAETLKITTDSILINHNNSQPMAYSYKDTIDCLLDGCTEDEILFFIDFIRLYCSRQRRVEKNRIDLKEQGIPQEYPAALDFNQPKQL